MIKPLTSQSATIIATMTAMLLGDPLGSWGRLLEPLPLPPPNWPPRLGLRPNNDPSRLLKSRQTSSRSGGDRKSVVSGTSGSVGVDTGGRRRIKQKRRKKYTSKST